MHPSRIHSFASIHVIASLPCSRSAVMPLQDRVGFYAHGLAKVYRQVAGLLLLVTVLVGAACHLACMIPPVH